MQAIFRAAGANAQPPLLFALASTRTEVSKPVARRSVASIDEENETSVGRLLRRRRRGGTDPLPPFALHYAVGNLALPAVGQNHSANGGLWPCSRPSVRAEPDYRGLGRSHVGK